MNVLVRNKRGEKATRRRRPSSGLFTGDRYVDAARPDEQPVETPEQSRADPAPQTGRIVDDTAPGRRRLHGPVQDNAVYSCHCGYVFEAAVSTSVDCPHCGGGQAW
jgi:hypothetical protein